MYFYFVRQDINRKKHQSSSLVRQDINRYMLIPYGKMIYYSDLSIDIYLLRRKFKQILSIPRKELNH